MSRKRVPLNQNECTADFRIGVPFEQNLQCDPYNYNGTRIFRELKERGYTGSIGPIYRFLGKVDEDVGSHISKKATVRHESPPGDQAQFDWTEYEVLVGNRYRKVYCFQYA